VLSGRVSEALERHARGAGVDLTVMATHGRGAFSRAWLGSVADAFLRHAPCPVLLVRPDQDKLDLSLERGLTRMVVPLDGTELSESILDPAIALAEPFGARILLLRVVAYPIEIASPYLPHTVHMNQAIVEEAKASSATYLETHAESLRERGMAVETDVLVDSQAGHGILQASEAWRADVIAMATHGRTGMARTILGSAADKVVRGAHGAVLVYRPDLERRGAPSDPRHVGDPPGREEEG
jgi:nucleotide-binding universal stress UspA family protein